MLRGLKSALGWNYQPIASPEDEEDDWHNADGRQPAKGELRRRIGEPNQFRANCTLPQELRFVVPAKHNLNKPVCIQGPHGPLMVDVPKDAGPGCETSVTLGPNILEAVVVPDGYRPGEMITFRGACGKELQVIVPEGKLPGDTLEVTPPALMVQVPVGAQVGDKLICDGPDGKDFVCEVPSGAAEGSYFAALI
eukprot:TRINITY_DN784_c0_g1_i4.p1 TRINITY_DN784_c0_g1~~TRINITY_DN784_c0_g1_i4.p1  ORF type:complete len:194 (+),score=32.26 TRINITY_DN784_c0_g1_i4:141-722(+)